MLKTLTTLTGYSQLKTYIEENQDLFIRDKEETQRVLMNLEKRKIRGKDIESIRFEIVLDGSNSSHVWIQRVI